MNAVAASPRTLHISATLRDYQEIFLEDYLATIAVAQSGTSYLYSSPTGTGKSLMELAALAADPVAILVTPRLEIVAGMLNKLGVATSGWSDEKLAAEAASYRIFTPIRLRNMLMKGHYPYDYPRRVIIDEAHHDLADTYQQIRAFLPGAVFFGLTATPFRGTPKGTAEFMKCWGGASTQILSLKQAVERGVIEIPTAAIWPFCDDDEIEVVNGDFRTIAAGERVRSRLDEVVERCREFVDSDYDAVTRIFDRIVPVTKVWDRPTMFALPTTDTVRDLVTRLNAAGLPAVGVTQDTPRSARNDAFQDCVASCVAIVQIDVVSEGVDLPIRRLIDLRPTLSPVKWLQQVGRITRPGGNSEYICCCRNLERHAYLMNGLIPAARIAEAQTAFENKKPTKRAGARAVGLENLGRFQGSELPLADGTTGLMYCLYSMDRHFRKTNYAILTHPCVESPLIARAVHQGAADGTATYGRWHQIESMPDDLRGFASAPAKAISDKQRAWWTRDATKFGLDVNAEPTKRTFAALPVLADLSKTGRGRVRLTVGGF